MWQVLKKPTLFQNQKYRAEAPDSHRLITDKQKRIISCGSFGENIPRHHEPRPKRIPMIHFFLLYQYLVYIS